MSSLLSSLSDPATEAPAGRPEGSVLVTESAAVPVLSSGGALLVASALAEQLAGQSARRDAERDLPVAELQQLAASGLLAATVPREYGGADLPPSVLAEAIRRISVGDPNVAQIPHSHFVHVYALRSCPLPQVKEFLLAEVLRGRWFGNAQAELGTRHGRELATVLTPVEDDANDANDANDAPQRWLLNGEKGYCTGAYYADWLPVLAHLGEAGPLYVAWVERGADGVTVTDDWDGIGQRTTASGTVRLEDVEVAADRLTPYPRFTGAEPQLLGTYAQLLHAAIDAGIARAALTDAATFVTTRSRPYPDAEVDRHADDPLVVHAFGEVEYSVRAAESLLADAGLAVDRAHREPDPRGAAVASLAVATARIAAGRAAVEASNRLFELGGTRSALEQHNLHRHWRNARIHTLHDPEAWKTQHLGRYALDGTPPPQHSQL